MLKLNFIPTMFLAMISINEVNSADLVKFESSPVTESGKLVGCSLNYSAVIDNIRTPGSVLSFTGSLNIMETSTLPVIMIKAVGADADQLRSGKLVKKQYEYVGLITQGDISRYELGKNQCDPGSVCTIYGDSGAKALIDVISSFNQTIPGYFDKELIISISPSRGSLDVPIYLNKHLSKYNADAAASFSHCNMRILKNMMDRIDK